MLKHNVRHRNYKNLEKKFYVKKQYLENSKSKF